MQKEEDAHAQAARPPCSPAEVAEAERRVYATPPPPPFTLSGFPDVQQPMLAISGVSPEEDRAPHAGEGRLLPSESPVRQRSMMAHAATCGWARISPATGPHDTVTGMSSAKWAHSSHAVSALQTGNCMLEVPCLQPIAPAGLLLLMHSERSPPCQQAGDAQRCMARIFHDGGA